MEKYSHWGGFVKWCNRQAWRLDESYFRLCNEVLAVWSHSSLHVLKAYCPKHSTENRETRFLQSYNFSTQAKIYPFMLYTAQKSSTRKNDG